MNNTKTLYITKAAVIAALYVVLTLLSNSLGLANGAIQIRISEALTVLPFFIPAAIPGLFIGCLISNLLTGCLPWDIVFGSLATLIGAYGTYRLGKIKKEKARWLAPLPPIISNMLIIPPVLINVYNLEKGYLYFMLTIGIGEILSAGVLGMILQSNIYRRGNISH